MKALITGASSGIGWEIAKILSAKGYECVLAARRTDKLSELSQQLQGKSCVEECDLARPDSARDIFEKHSDAEFIVNCAGVGVFGDFSETELEREREMLEVNVISLHILTKLYLEAFLKKDRGIILNVASSAAFFSGPYFSSYYATKAYVLHLTEAVSYECRKTGVRVCTFCPGPVKTEFGKTDAISDGRGAISAEFAARKAVLGALQGKRIIYPNFSTRALVFFSRFLPRTLLLKIVANQQLKKAQKPCQKKENIV